RECQSPSPRPVAPASQCSRALPWDRVVEEQSQSPCVSPSLPIKIRLDFVVVVKHRFIDAEHWASAAAGSCSIAEAGGSRLQACVRPLCCCAAVQRTGTAADTLSHLPISSAVPGKGLVLLWVAGYPDAGTTAQWPTLPYCCEWRSCS